MECPGEFYSSFNSNQSIENHKKSFSSAWEFQSSILKCINRFIGYVTDEEQSSPELVLKKYLRDVGLPICTATLVYGSIFGTLYRCIFDICQNNGNKLNN